LVTGGAWSSLQAGPALEAIEIARVLFGSTCTQVTGVSHRAAEAPSRAARAVSVHPLSPAHAGRSTRQSLHDVTQQKGNRHDRGKVRRVHAD
jgi:hypothetical protein